MALAAIVLVVPAYGHGHTHSPAAGSAPLENAASVYPASYTRPWLADSHFVYGPRLLDFDLRAYLARSAPHLLPHAEFISHWCGYYSISPKVFLTILEMSRGIVSEERDVEPSLLRQEIQETLHGLYRDFYAYRESAEVEAQQTLSAATYALLNTVRAQTSVPAFATAVEEKRREFSDTHARLFPGSSMSEPLRIETAAVPPSDFLQLPWKIGQSWEFNGVHTTTGSDPGVMSSIDMVRTWSLVWGNDTSTDYVVAAHGGQVTRYSDCNVRITSPSGWATNYYHLGNVMVQSGQSVAANQTIGVYANTLSQALCQGGHSTGPHVHFSLLKDGAYAALDGTEISQYLVHSGRYSYDYDPAYMWLEKNGTRYYAYTSTLTSAAPALPPAMSINNVAALEGSGGSTTARFTISISEARSSDITVNYATADGTAESNSVSTTHSSALLLSVPAAGNASPYPTTVTVGSGYGPIAGATASLSGLSHAFPRDLDVLLTGPGGQTVLLMSDAGGFTPVSNVTLTFDDFGPSLGIGAISSGTYAPTNLADGEGDDVFSSPAPSAPYGASLSVFQGTNPAGSWKLFVRDDCCTDGGSLQGWALTLTTGSGDYVPRSGTLTIPAGTTSRTLDVVVTADSTVEPAETFVVNLSAPSGAILADSQGIGRIINDDFTDVSLAGAVVKSVHVTELQTLINELRRRRGLAPYLFTAPLTPGTSLIRASHILELRAALNAVYATAGLSTPGYTRAIAAGTTTILAVDITEIRTIALAAP